MSYGVHIVRISSRDHDKRESIPLNEWLAYIASDAEMRLKGGFVSRSPKGEEIRVNAPGLAEWIDPRDGARVMFDHGRGRISVGNPSHAALVKMARIAEKLKASVCGDEGEQYDVDGNHR